MSSAAPQLARSTVPTIATDIYALGVLLYQAVTGEWSRPLATGWQEEVADALLVDDVEAATAGHLQRRLASAARLAERLERLPERRAEHLRTAEAKALVATQARCAERARQRRPWAIGVALPS